MNDTNSLFYRLYKSKYFPTGTIFDAKHASGSFAWKSILKARRVILMGARWRVGDGRSISVFNDSWILGLPNGKVISSFSSLDRSISVADLINHDSGCWKVDVIENSFFSFEAQKILAIPLCTSAQHDLVYWPPEKNGIYSVKSGYKMCEEARREEARREEASSSTKSGGSGLWKGIWKLKVPGKLKHFFVEGLHW